MPALTATGFPDKVPAWYTPPSGARSSHDLPSSPESADGKTAADYLAEACEIRTNRVKLLSPSVSDPEARNDFVEHEEDTIFFTQVTDVFEETLLWQNDAHVAHNRLHDKAGDIALRLQNVPHRLYVVELGHERVSGEVSQYTLAVGHPIRRKAGSSLYEKAVHMAVIATIELDDAGLPRGSAGEPHGAHGRLCSGARESHLFHRWVGVDDHPREGRLKRVAGAEARAVENGCLYLACKALICVAEHDGAPGRNEVEVPVPIHIEKIGTLRPLHIERLFVDRGKGPDRAVDSARNETEGLTVKRF